LVRFGPIVKKNIYKRLFINNKKIPIETDSFPLNSLYGDVNHIPSETILEITTD
jgi:hypothetical protein